MTLVRWGREEHGTAAAPLYHAFFDTAGGRHPELRGAFARSEGSIVIYVFLSGVLFRVTKDPLLRLFILNMPFYTIQLNKKL